MKRREKRDSAAPERNAEKSSPGNSRANGESDSEARAGKDATRAERRPAAPKAKEAGGDPPRGSWTTEDVEVDRVPEGAGVDR